MLQQFGCTSASQEGDIIGLWRERGFLVHLVFHMFVFVCVFLNFLIFSFKFFFPHPTNESCLGLGVLRSTFHKQEFYGSEEVTSGRPSALLGVKQTLTLHSDRSFPDTPTPHGSRTGIDPEKGTEREIIECVWLLGGCMYDSTALWSDVSWDTRWNCMKGSLYSQSHDHILSSGSANLWQL